jgi:hypothetical protein
MREQLNSVAPWSKALRTRYTRREPVRCVEWELFSWDLVNPVAPRSNTWFSFAKYCVPVGKEFTFVSFAQHVTPCSPVEVHLRFGGTYCLHLLALLPACFLLVLLYWFTLRHWKWRQYVPPKRQLLLPDYTVSLPEDRILVSSWYLPGIDFHLSMAGTRVQCPEGNIGVCARARCGSLPRQQGRLPGND